MSAIKQLNRILLAGVFIIGGAEAFMKPGTRPEKVAKAGIPNAQQAVEFNGAAMVIGGTALAVGIFPRLAALGLFASMIPTTFVGHPFWEEETPAARKMQQTQFLKNLAIMGGLLQVVLDSDVD